MSTMQAAGRAATAIDPATEVGFLSLTVADLARSVAFYTDAIGMALLDQGDGTATLGVAGTPLLVVTERTGAQPWPREQRSYTGLYHFAILVPTRADLGRWVRHWLELGLPLGQGDHLVSEALYLSDPDENGIEVYRDRPRDEWTWANGQGADGHRPGRYSRPAGRRRARGRAVDRAGRRARISGTSTCRSATSHAPRRSITISSASISSPRCRPRSSSRRVATTTTSA